MLTSYETHGVENLKSRKYKQWSLAKMSNIFCPQTRNYFKKLVLSKCNFFRRETKSSVNDFIVELHGCPPLFVLLLQL